MESVPARDLLGMLGISEPYSGFVTIWATPGAGRRGWRIGWAEAGRVPDHTSGPRAFRGRYEGRNWFDRLILDAWDAVVKEIDG